MAYHILPHFPEHREYVEPFFGTGALLLSKKPGKVETVNDLDGNVCNFFRILRDYPDDFIKLANLTEYSRDLFYNCIEGYKIEKDPIRRAWMFWVVSRLSFGGGMSSFGTVTTKSSQGFAETCRGVLSSVEGLVGVVRRLQRVQIENTDAKTVITRYTTPNSLCYCDPPYLPDTRKRGGYDFEMTEEEHIELLKLLMETPGKVIISGYPSDIYDNILDGWVRKDFKVTCHLAGRTKASSLQGKGMCLSNQKRTECIWINPAAQKKDVGQLKLF